MSLQTLMALLGHTSAKVTLDTYADLFDDDLDAVATTLHKQHSRANVLKACSPGADESR
ncbi:hypothetical protein JMUB5695_00271 [Mycobacterium heckeshornense]|uniref:hypothetical protein n=1 Tax=Mycobacterium heckeshornense TaxID=110505 RepID=UPI001AF96345|nr:hypothetical protein JMUB5695_00271 [Mycobacterium heckeshornense]